MGATGITAVKNACVAKIDAGWTGRGPDDVVTGAGRIDEVIAESLGRKVYVFRSGRADAVGTRGEDQHDYTLVIWIVERYTGAGDPPEDWIDARVVFAEWLLDFIGNVRGERLLADPAKPDSGLWPQVAALTTAYDVEDLTQYKTFSSVLTITYREVS